jgi:hypothetical protein
VRRNGIAQSAWPETEKRSFPVARPPGLSLEVPFTYHRTRRLRDGLPSFGAMAFGCSEVAYG